MVNIISYFVIDLMYLLTEFNKVNQVGVFNWFSVKKAFSLAKHPV